MSLRRPEGSHATGTGTDAAFLACHRCAWRGDLTDLYACPMCGSSLLVDYHGFDRLPDGSPTEGLWRYRTFLPVEENATPITLGEGGTPLLRGLRLDPSRRTFLKNETSNPTASFKDRPVSVASTVARELGLDGLLCASTGNTAVAVAAYAAQAGLPAACLVPEKTPAAKLRQIEVSGARILRVRGDYSDAYTLARRAAELCGWANLTSTYINPYMLEGDKTIAYEVFEQLGRRPPDWVIVPVGAGPLLAAIYKGFRELAGFEFPGFVPPCMVAVQAEGCAPIASAFEAGEEVREWDRDIVTGASSIGDPLRGYPEDGQRTLDAASESGGRVIAVSEEETYRALRDLARLEGLFVEPGAAVAVAAYRRMVEQGTISSGETTTLVLTGHGLKDPEVLSRTVPEQSDSTVVETGDTDALENLLEVSR